MGMALAAYRQSDCPPLCRPILTCFFYFLCCTHLAPQIDKAAKIKTSAESNASDLDVADESGNVILRLEEGHLQTKNFKSKLLKFPTPAQCECSE